MRRCGCASKPNPSWSEADISASVALDKMKNEEVRMKNAQMKKSCWNDQQPHNSSFFILNS
jgi:hypothetical protein